MQAELCLRLASESRWGCVQSWAQWLCRALFCFHHGLWARPGAVLARTVGAAGEAPCRAQPGLEKQELQGGFRLYHRAALPQAFCPHTHQLKEGRWDCEIIS